MTLAGSDPSFALAQSLFTARAPQVQDVWVRGRLQVQDGKHLLAEAAKRRFDTVVQSLLQGAA